MSRGPRAHRAQVETHLAEVRARPKDALRDAAGRRRAVSPAGVAAIKRRAEESQCSSVVVKML